MKNRMKGQVFKNVPGYLSPGQVAERFGISRQLFYRTGLADAMNRYKAGGSNATLFAEEDVANMERWLKARKGLIALGVLSGKHPLAPTEEEYRAALAGHWDATCPVCGDQAVKDPDTGRIWCPEHGVVNSEGDLA